MSDIIPQLGAWVPAATASGLGAKLAWNMFGPPSKALGRRMEHFVDEFHLDRFSQVVQNAAKKVPELENTPGEVPSRVLGRIFDESEWIEDAVIVEYLGGILASSRTPDGRDDRGISWTACIRDLSAYTLRLHYTIYTALRQVMQGRFDSVANGEHIASAHVFIPNSVLSQAMDFADDEDADNLIGHALFALVARGFIAEDFAHSDDVEWLRSHRVPNAPDGGLRVRATALGVEFYLWALGYGQLPVDGYLDPNLDFELPVGIDVSEGTAVISDMRAIETAAVETETTA